VDQALIRRAADAVGEADALLFCAGAGMGVDSGLPDFRGDEGFWKAYPPIAKLGYSFIDMADPAWFERDPALAWGFYGHRLNLYRETEPHAGFGLMLKWAARAPRGAFVFTSNVDGQFQRAGFDSDLVEECHGSIHHLQCASPCHPAIWQAAGVEVAVAMETLRAANPLPLCPRCGGLARPNILMFGDFGWLGERAEAQSERLSAWLRGLSGGRITVVECGAGGGVPTVRMTSESLVRLHGATLIRVNPREPRVPEGQISIAAGAAETLAAIDSLL
jgi:NAD-dependent SIR2 family protein deacetylase